MTNQQPEITEGTLEFVINPGKVNYNDNKTSRLVQLSPQNGSILMVKDSDNKLKFFHVYMGKGRTDIEHDVSNLDSNEKHYFAVTWSVKDKIIILYINGQQVAKSDIEYENEKS